jgi:hypothetical protein
MIKHISGDLLTWTPDDGTPPVVVLRVADKHEVQVGIPAAWPGSGRCDSCGRVVVRGMGRWWEGRYPR